MKLQCYYILVTIDKPLSVSLLAVREQLKFVGDLFLVNFVDLGRLAVRLSHFAQTHCIFNCSVCKPDGLQVLDSSVVDLGDRAIESISQPVLSVGPFVVARRAHRSPVH